MGLKFSTAWSRDQDRDFWYYKWWGEYWVLCLLKPLDFQCTYRTIVTGQFVELFLRTLILYFNTMHTYPAVYFIISRLLVIPNEIFVISMYLFIYLILDLENNQRSLHTWYK